MITKTAASKDSRSKRPSLTRKELRWTYHSVCYISYLSLALTVLVWRPFCLEQCEHITSWVSVCANSARCSKGVHSSPWKQIARMLLLSPFIYFRLLYSPAICLVLLEQCKNSWIYPNYTCYFAFIVKFFPLLFFVIWLGTYIHIFITHKSSIIQTFNL